MSDFLKAEKVASTAVGLLMREIVLPQLVWRDAGGSFKGAKNDTITLRVPAYVTARTRALRNTDAITIDELNETSVDVTLDTDVYKGVYITDEELTLDIVDFGMQVLSPVVSAVAMGIEDLVATAIAGATYTLTGTFSEADPLGSVLAARTALNKCNVPMQGRALLVGAEIEEIILAALAGRESGAGVEVSALTDATIAANYGGFRVISSNAIAPDAAYAFHKSAFVLSTQAPAVPDGVSWGSSQSYAGLAMRVIKDYDPDYVRDRMVAGCYAGADVVYDNGELNDDGQFVPFETEAEIGSGTPILVRAYEFTLGS